MDDEMQFRVDSSEPGVLKLFGELDMLTAVELDAALEPLDGTPIEIDLSGLRFADSSGLRALVRARRNHHGVRFVAPTPALTRLIAISGLTDVLLLTDDPDPAQPHVDH